MSLKTETFKLIDDTMALCDECSGSEDFKNKLVALRERLNEPLRVAVTGIMKAGKSTFMNALMGESLVYTGSLETTYTVCWFKYSEKPYITVCFRDGKKENADYSDLKKWSIREYADENPRMNEVKYLIIYYPNEILKTIEFIDTPGLNSVYVTDSENTVDFLEIQRADKETRLEASAADAIIYAFSRGVGNFDENLLNEFHKGLSTSSPVNSIGVLTRIDDTGIWNVYSQVTATEAARPVLESIIQKSSIQRLLYSVYPVCAKQVEGMSQLTDGDWSILKKMSTVKEDELQDAISDSNWFANSTDEYYMNFGTASERRSLLDKIGQYGIKEISRLLAEKNNKDEIVDSMEEICGISEVRHILKNHFGNRTFLIKTQFIFAQLRKFIENTRANDSYNKQLLDVCIYLENRIDELMTNTQTLNELRILQYYYNGLLKLTDDELNDFMHITGEYGREPEKRLDVDTGVSMHDMMNVAKSKITKWHTKASAFMMSAEYVDAANTIARSYEYVYYHISSLCEE